MATSKKFSELPAASSVGNGDLFAIAHEDALAETGYVSQKLTAAQAGQKVNGDTEYPTRLPSFPANGQNPFAALEKLNSDIIGLLPVSTASGSIATFTTSLALPLVECKAEITAQQASGTPTPSNPLPITGFDSVNSTKTGKNLFNLSFEDTVEGGITYTVNSNKTVTAIGTSTGAKNLACGTATLKAGTYFVSGCIDGGNNTYRLQVLDDNSGNLALDTGTGLAFTISRDMTVSIRIQIRASDVNINTVFSPMIEHNTTATTYEPYNGETKTIALGQTIYGGSVDCINGKSVITHKAIKVKDLTWSKGSGGNTTRFYSNAVSDILAPDTTSSDMPSIIAEDYATVSYFNRIFYEDLSIAINTNKAINITDSNYSTADAFKTAMGECLIVYPLATPQEITGLTGVNFTTSEGEQNIFADCGEVSVSFKQGIQEYIDAKIAETQALIL